MTATGQSIFHSAAFTKCLFMAANHRLKAAGVNLWFFRSGKMPQL